MNAVSEMATKSREFGMIKLVAHSHPESLRLCYAPRNDRLSQNKL